MLSDYGAGHLPARLDSPMGRRDCSAPGCVHWSASEDTDALRGCGIQADILHSIAGLNRPGEPDLRSGHLGRRVGTQHTQGGKSGRTGFQHGLHSLRAGVMDHVGVEPVLPGLVRGP